MTKHQKRMACKECGEIEHTKECPGYVINQAFAVLGLIVALLCIFVGGEIAIALFRGIKP